MTGWIQILYGSLLGAALLLSALGLWFIAVIPGMDRWSKRFFCGISSFLCCAAFPASRKWFSNTFPRRAR